jgi:hypothetical protein
MIGESISIATALSTQFTANSFQGETGFTRAG